MMAFSLFFWGFLGGVALKERKNKVGWVESWGEYERNWRRRKTGGIVAQTSVMEKVEIE